MLRFEAVVRLIVTDTGTGAATEREGKFTHISGNDMAATTIRQATAQVLQGFRSEEL